MKNLLRAEEVAQLGLPVAGFYYQPIHIAWWLWLPVFLSPDLSMVGYLFNSRVGAVSYNIAHHKAIAGAAIALGLMFHLPALLFIGPILWAHSSFDRILGYGEIPRFVSAHPPRFYRKKTVK